MEKVCVVYIDFHKGNGWEKFATYEGNQYGYEGACRMEQMIFADGFWAKIEMEDKKEVMKQYCGLEEAS